MVYWSIFKVKSDLFSGLSDRELEESVGRTEIKFFIEFY
jgi:hypothetical protein